MSFYQPAVGLPPLSAIAPVSHEPTVLAASNTSGLSSLNASTIEHRDARIKDPVPKKLKGQASSANGNFGVLQMELTGHDTSFERNALAKRASESTELAAIRAYQSGYGIPSASKRFVRLHGDPSALEAFSAAPAAASIAGATTAPTAVATATPTTNPPPVARTLTPAETKEEQARLLSLLRNLSPTAVVDQLCKAVFYFGGVPGDPPPADGAFPRSELENGPGNMFVGWIAEIFPKLPNQTTNAIKSIKQPDTQSTDDAPPVTEKRPRGRPKGSKATKARKDKGIKKGPVKARQALAAAAAAAAASGTSGGANTSGAIADDLHAHPQSAPNGGDGHIEDDSWVDVDDSVLQVAGVGGNTFFSPTAGTVANHAPALQSQSGPNQAVLPVGLDNAATATGTEAVKKRGRPKGSKNKPKPTDADNHSNSANQSSHMGNVASNAIDRADRATTAIPTTVTPIPPPVIPGIAVAQKANDGRPKTSTAKPKDPALHAPHAQAAGGQGFGLTSIQQAFGIESGATGGSQLPGLPGDTSNAAAAGVKRKRAKASKKDTAAADKPQGYTSTAFNGVLAGPGGDDMQSAPAEENATSMSSAAKKQRKATDARTSVRSGNHSTSPAARPSTVSTVGLGAAVSMAGEAHLIPPLDGNGADSPFGAVTFETLSSQLGQGAPGPMAGPHQGAHSQSLSSRHMHQLSSDQRQQSRPQPLGAQKAMSTTPPLQGGAGDQIQGLDADRQHSQSQQQQPHAQSQQHSQVHAELPPYQPQPQHLHPQTSSHTLSFTPPQHTAQSHIGGPAASAGVPSQQLPQPNRTPQSYFPQSRPGGDQFSHHQSQAPQSQQQQQQQQQQQKQAQFAPQYHTNSQYGSQPQTQAFPPQQRHTPQSTTGSSPNLLTQGSSHRSPQFGSAGTTFGAPSNAYASSPGGGSLNFSSSSFGQSRRTNNVGSPLLSGPYGPAGPTSHNLSHHGSPSFGASRPQPSPATPHVGSTAQSMQNFHSFDNQSLFDGINLDATPNNGALGLGGTPPYMSGNVPRTSPNSGAYGTATAMNSFDASMGGNHLRERYYSVRR